MKDLIIKIEKVKNLEIKKTNKLNELIDYIIAEISPKLYKKLDLFLNDIKKLEYIKLNLKLEIEKNIDKYIEKSTEIKKMIFETENYLN